MFFNDKSLKFTPKQKEAMQLLNIEDTDSLLSYYPFRYEILEVKPYISTLESFLSVIKTNKIIIIEIKEEGNINDKLINNLFKILKKYNYLNVYLCSFNYNLMKKIKLKYSNYKCGLIIGYLMNKNHVSNEFDFYLYSYNNINLINNDKEIFIFNVKNIDRLDKLKLKKEFYIITDKPYYFSSL